MASSVTRQDCDPRKRTLGDQIKLTVDILQSLFTIGAILAAGWWFIKQESIKPQVKIEQTVTQRALGNNPSEILITVDVRATNMGKTKVELDQGVTEVSQVNPIPGYSIIKYPLRRLLLEPGESDQALFRTVRLNKTTLTIQLHSEYPVPHTNEVWNLLSAVDIGEKPTKKESAASVN
jgi:hypothetical protein